MTKAKASKGSGGATARQNEPKARPSTATASKGVTSGAKGAPSKMASTAPLKKSPPKAPAPKAPPAKVSASKAPAKVAAKAPSKPAPKAPAKAAPKAPAKAAPKAPAAKAPAKAAAKAPAKAAPKAPEVVAVVAEAAPVTEGLRVKKKVKRGAPPMLPRRMARRPPAPGSVAPGSSPPPPPKPTAPGSLHTPARSPEGAEQLKVRIIAVKNELGRVKALKRNLNKTFWEVGEILGRLAEPALFQAIGYGSWETFIEREVERDLGIGRTMADDLRRIVKVFQREVADEVGLERLRTSLRALYPEPGHHPAGSTASLPSAAGAS